MNTPGTKTTECSKTEELSFTKRKHHMEKSKESVHWNNTPK
jgi:hypothetical protein